MVGAGLLNSDSKRSLLQCVAHEFVMLLFAVPHRLG
jgi:hypothetical protein